MNKFIWREYLILTKLEQQKRGYLGPLHQKFSEAFPEMDASRQRIGDQRRAIINNKLLSQQSLDAIREEVSGYLEHIHDDSTQINSTGNTQNTLIIGERMRWSDEMFCYYQVTDLEENMIQATISGKITKYHDLAIQLKTQWRAQTIHVIPIVLSSTGIIPKLLKQSFEMLDIPSNLIYRLQKASILNTCRITRKFLSTGSTALHPMTLG